MFSAIMWDLRPKLSFHACTTFLRTKGMSKGAGGVEISLRSHKQKILGSNPVAACPERRALKTQYSCVNM
jgi:hypothetical protein